MKNNGGHRMGYETGRKKNMKDTENTNMAEFELGLELSLESGAGAGAEVQENPEEAQKRPRRNTEEAQEKPRRGPGETQERSPF